MPIKREKLIRERIIELPKQLERSGADPFLVDVKGLLNQIRGRSGSVKALAMDSKALNSLSKVVEMQERWVVDALRGLRVDPGMIRERISKLGLRDLAVALAENFYPALGLRRMSEGRLKDGLTYWGVVRPWGSMEKPPPVDYREFSVEPIDLSFESLKEKAEAFMRTLEKELAKGPIDYHSYLSKFEGKGRLEKAFLIAHLTMTGRIALKQEPLTRRVLILLPKGGEASSIAIPLEVK